MWSLSEKSPIAEIEHKDVALSCAYSTKYRSLMIGTKTGYIEIYETSVIVQRLVDICRKVVNQYVDRDEISELTLPIELRKFLLYDDILDRTACVSQRPYDKSPKLSSKQIKSSNLII